jgi:aspartokinase/homoserine dehydrogenase 1
MQAVESIHVSPALRLPAAPKDVVVGLIGPGNVGSRVLDLMSDHAGSARRLLAIADSRRMQLSETCLARPGWRQRLRASREKSRIDELVRHLAAAPARRRILVDVTAAPEIAARHADWLAAGFEVVTANKWAAAGDPAQWPRLNRPGYRYATTVGAGLPVLETLGRLQAAGDRLLSIEGVLSGTLSYLTKQVSAGRDFAESVREAHSLGLSEPDPRLDLGGLDVARKLVIAARAAGLSLDLSQVSVESLVPPETQSLSTAAFLEEAGALRRHWHSRSAACPGEGRALVHVGCASVADDGRVRARVGLQRVAADHPFAALGAGDNMVAIRTATYREQPIWIRGPGAGADITARQVWADLVAPPRG